MSRKPKRSLFDALDLDAPHVTEVRRLLQSLMRRGLESGRQIYMVTSARRGDGKSTTCGLMGIVAAQIFRKRTLVIDADVRAATMHHLLAISRQPGFSEILQGRASLDASVHTTASNQLFAIPIGTPLGRLSEAYDDRACRALLEQVRSQYDLILVDAAPVVPVVEPMMIAEHVDGLLVVAMAGRTPLTMIRRMKQILEPAESKIAGVILSNAVNGLPYYYDYRYYGYEQPGLQRVRSDRPSSGDQQSRPKSPAA